MATLPRATTVVSDTAGAVASGLDTLCLWSPVATSADVTPRLFGNADAIVQQHGYCEGVEYAALHFAQTRKPILFVGLPIATPGAIGRVDTTGNTGTSVVGVTAGVSGALNEHDGVVTVISGGTIGTDQIVLGLSLDGGRTSQRVRLSTASSYVIPNEGVTLSFASGDLEDGDVVITWHASAPRSDATGWAAARVKLAAQQRSFRKILLCGDLASDTEAAALLAQINAYKTANERAVYCCASVYDREPQAALSTESHAKSGTATLTFADADDTIKRSAGSWITDGFAVGDVVETSSATNAGPFVVTAVTALVLTVEADDLADEGPTATVTVTGYVGLEFTASTDVVTRSSGSWVADGFRAGDVVTVAGASPGGNNNGEFTVAAVTALALDLGDGLSDEVAAAGTVTIVAGQTKAAWMAEIDAEFATIDAAPRISLCAGRGRVSSPYSSWYPRRSVAWAVTLREFTHDLHVAPWRKDDGPTGFDLYDADGVLEEWDDRVDGEAGVAARFTCFRTWANGPNGAFIALSLTRASDASLLVQTQNVAVVNLAENLVQLNTENAAIGVSLVLNADGTATTDSLSLTESKVNSALKLGLLTPGREGPRASSAKWTTDASVLYNVAEPVMLGTLDLLLNGTNHSVYTTVRVISGGQ